MKLNVGLPPSSSTSHVTAPPALNSGRPALRFADPPVSIQAPGGSLPDNEAEISSLKQKLADEKAARRVGQSDLLDAQAEVREFQIQLTKLREEQQAALDSLRQDLQNKAKQDQEAQSKKLTKDAEDTVNGILSKWKAHYEGQIAGLRTQLHNSNQAHGSTTGSTAQLERELASAKQQIADHQRIKAEDDAAEQRAAEAQNRVNSLETQLRAAQAEVARSSQALQDAQEQTYRVQEANETLRSQLETVKQNHQNAVDEMSLTVAEHAKQYTLDIEAARSQHFDQRDSGGRGHKRPRDNSNGRDKRRS